MAETLYIKYRPLTFDSVVGQQHIVKTLQNAIKTDRMAHAYMFCGPRGTGKTTMARILAKACLCTEPGSTAMPANNTEPGSTAMPANNAEQVSAEPENATLPTPNPCGHCPECNDIAAGTHPDVYELDAASRTGVENVREEIIGRVNFAATRGAKKIYIIDEVHMLSIAAFNALLKTLEEPPEHVVFILCTTDPQKVPETILSRCQRFDFRAISVEDIAARLAKVCENEKVNAEEEALKIIAQSARGGMRNALTTLEQMFAYCSGSVTADEVRKNLGSQASGDLRGLLASIAAGDLATAFTWLDNYNNEGADYPRLTQGIIRWARAEYVSTAANNKPIAFINAGKTVFFTPELLHLAIVEMGELANNFKVVPDAKLAFEVCVAKLTHPATVEGMAALSARVAKLEESGVTHSVVATPQESAVFEEAVTPQVATAPREEAVTPQEVTAPREDAASCSGKMAPQEVTEEEHPLEAEKQIKPETEVQPGDKPIQPQPDDKTRLADTQQAASDPQHDTQQAASDPQHDTQQAASNAQTDADIMAIWRKALVEINEQFPAYGAILTCATPSYRETTNQLILTFPYSQRFAAKQMSNQLVADKISKIVKDVSGKNYGFDAEVAPEEEKYDPIANIQQQQNSAPQKIDDMRKNLHNEMENEPPIAEPNFEKPQTQQTASPQAQMTGAAQTQQTASPQAQQPGVSQTQQPPSGPAQQPGVSQTQQPPSGPAQQPGATQTQNTPQAKQPNPVVSDEDKQDMAKILSQFGAINIKED